VTSLSLGATGVRVGGIARTGRGFGIKTGIDHVDTPEKLAEMVRFFAEDLFGVEVTEIEEA
jgi:hypothetical protein